MKIIKGDIAVLEHDTHISKWVQEHESLIHNKWLYGMLSAFINPDSVVLEGGAFIGDNTAFLSKLAKYVMSFEPNKEAYDCLEYNFKNINNVTCFNKGLGDKKGRAGILRDKNAGATHLCEGSEIEITTIDDIGFKQLHFIILDCEGYEFKILKGGEDTIKKFRPTMLIEINNGHLGRNNTSDNDLFVYLTELGYEFKNLDSKKSIYEEQLDLICIPK